MSPANVDQLASLADRPGWKHTTTGWIHKRLDISVERTNTGHYLIAHAGQTLELTTATGVLCWIDQHARNAAAAKATSE